MSTASPCTWLWHASCYKTLAKLTVSQSTANSFQKWYMVGFQMHSKQVFLWDMSQVLDADQIQSYAMEMVIQNKSFSGRVESLQGVASPKCH